jgi:predicted AAA+ superfamily ATPase
MDAGLVYKVSRVKELRMPVKLYEDLGAFKLFLLDCGLLGCLADAPAKEMILGNNVFQEFKGAFTEQFVLQQLVSQNMIPYYWSNDNTPAKIDFVIQSGDHVIPIEVKAEENVIARSMRTYIERHSDLHLKGLRISMLGYIDQGWMENIPLYGISKYFQ